MVHVLTHEQWPAIPLCRTYVLPAETSLVDELVPLWQWRSADCEECRNQASTLVLLFHLGYDIKTVN